MFDWIKNASDKIKHLNLSVDKYKEDTVIQSLPSVALVNRAKRLIEANELDAARKVLEEAAELPQKDALVYKYLGVVDEKLGNIENAIKNYKYSARLNSHDKEIWKKLGFALVNSDKAEEAEESFENANKISPQNTDVYTGWGMSLMKQQKFAEAREKFVIASHINKYNSTSLLLAAIMEVKLGDLVSAETKLNFLANVNPTASSSYELASLKFIKEEYDEALHYAKKALEFNDLMLPAYLLAANVYTIKFDEENALSCYKKAEEKGLEGINLYIEWGNSLLRFGYPSEAKMKFLKAYEINDINVEVRAGLGLCFAYEENYDEASPLVDRCVDNVFMKEALGLISMGCEDFEKAVDYFNEAVKLEPKSITIYHHLAKCYEKLKKYTKVKDNYEQILILNPKFIGAVLDYAKFLISQNDCAEAQRKLRKIVKFYPDNTDVLNLLFNVNYTLVKDNICEYNIKETLAIAEKIQKLNPEIFEYADQKEELIEILETIKKEK